MNFVEINTAPTLSYSHILFILTISSIWFVLVFYSLKKNGWKKTTRYFIPMMGAALFIEASAVASGRYLYPGYLFYISVIGGAVPLIILLGWSTNLFLFLSLSKKITSSLSTKRTLLRMILISIVTGCIGVLLDLLEDPIAHHNTWWVWAEQTPKASLYGVPITNFFDWFIILFYMAFITQLIDHSSLTENRKLAISLISISYTGAAIYITHTILMNILTIFHVV